jgi:hypothetical protein
MLSGADIAGDRAVTGVAGMTFEKLSDLKCVIPAHAGIQRRSSLCRDVQCIPEH